MSKEGLGSILGVLLFAIVISCGVIITNNLPLKVVALFSWLLFLLVLYFFRDPRRKIPQSDKIIVSAADGRVVGIRKVNETEYLKASATQISILLSIFNVHVNRVPMSGKVTYFDYRRGRFNPASKREASLENEQTVIGIENDRCKILIKQIAGIIARRIICNLREGSSVKCGEKFGIIKFGSRVDMILPQNVRILVEPKKKVRAGESIIGEIQHEK